MIWIAAYLYVAGVITAICYAESEGELDGSRETIIVITFWPIAFPFAAIQGVIEGARNASRKRREG